MSSSDIETPPTRARFVLVAWLCALSSILYLDRICMAQAVKPIQKELDLSKTEMSYVMMAFTLTYGIFAVPAGRWGDKVGPRSVLSLLVLAWSVFTALTGAATGLITMILVRLLFGAAEAGAFPNAARVMSRWYPVGERGRVQGIMLAFAQVGAIVAPAATAYLIEAVSWRWTFAAYALIGALWAVGFWLWFRNDPAEHRGVNAAELDAIRASVPPPPADPGPIPWRAILTNRGIIVLAVIMILASFFTYFFYSWFPTYLIDARGVENVEAGWLTSLVIGGSAVGMLVGGWLSDRISRLSANPVRDRRYLSMSGFLGAAACMFIGLRCESALALAALWSASMCVMHIQLPNWWSAIIPQAGRHVGAVFGLANGIGVLGAMASQGFAGLFADYQEKTRGLKGRAAWDPMFDLYVCVLLAGAVAWWMYRFTPLDDPAPTPPTEESW